MTPIDEIPQIGNPEWSRVRKVRIKFRRDDRFVVKPKTLRHDGKIVEVHHPWPMPQASEGGHALYADDVCWDLVECSDTLPGYLSEHDFEKILDENGNW